MNTCNEPGVLRRIRSDEEGWDNDGGFLAVPGLILDPGLAEVFQFDGLLDGFGDSFFEILWGLAGDDVAVHHAHVVDELDFAVAADVGDLLELFVEVEIAGGEIDHMGGLDAGEAPLQLGDEGFEDGVGDGAGFGHCRFSGKGGGDSRLWRESRLPAIF